MDATQATIAYVGFWRRFIAYIIDYFLIGITLFALAAALSLVMPGLPRALTFELPFGILTTNRTVEEKSTENKSEGAKTTVTEKVVEQTVAGLWSYLYRVTETKTAADGDSSQPKTETKWQQIDPVTKQDIDTSDLGTWAFFTAFLYFAAMESSKYQATFGKMAMGAKVTDRHGARLNFPRALLRNVSKILSMITLGIGFMMAGWSQKKQGLHDMISETYVVSAW